MGIYSRADLADFQPRFDSLVGIDSDGCVFDTMDIKQKRFFHGRIVSFWGLEAIEQYVRRAAEFVNLGSKSRGSNRFVALLRVFRLLHDWPEAAASGCVLPDCEALAQYLDSGLPLGNPSLAAEAERTGDPNLQRVLEWSLDINEAIAREMPPVPPFEWVVESLDLVQQHSDAIVVSQTPEEALVNEWQKHDLAKYVQLIAGQELGTKAEHLALATADRYASDRVLMVGDALGDLAAARTVGVLFFPILPGHEVASWHEFLTVGYPRFLDGTFAGVYAEELVGRFEDSLPDSPPWQPESRDR